MRLLIPATAATALALAACAASPGMVAQLDAKGFHNARLGERGPCTREGDHDGYCVRFTSDQGGGVAEGTLAGVYILRRD